MSPVHQKQVLISNEVEIEGPILVAHCDDAVPHSSLRSMMLKSLQPLAHLLSKKPQKRVLLDFARGGKSANGLLLEL